MIGMEAVRVVPPGDATFSVRERLARGKHGTEVTETTEGDWDGGCVGSRAGRRHFFGARTAGRGQASHRGHGDHRGGIGTEAVWVVAPGDATFSVRERLARG